MSNSVTDVQRFISKLNKFDPANLETYCSGLDLEVYTIKENLRYSAHFTNRMVERLQNWIDNIGCTRQEIEDFISYYKIRSDKLVGLRMISKSQYNSPADINTMLGQYIIGQERAQKILSSAIYIHLLRCGLVKPLISAGYTTQNSGLVPLLPNPNIVLIGSTGTGKTYILKTIASVFRLPFLKVDCASLTSTGYYGNGLNEHLYTFLNKCQESKQDINQAIIFFDEFDKLSEMHYARSGGSLGGVEMQQEFLNIIEDKEILLYPPKGSQNEGKSLNLSNCMFVFGGSFYGIERIVEKRLGKHQRIGFKMHEKNTNDDAPVLSHVNPHDLVEFGILPELVGRINHVVSLEEHNLNTIISIIKNSAESPLKAYENYFEMHHDTLVIEEDVYELIAEKILEANTGARAIYGVLNELLKDLLYHSPNLIEEKLVVDKAYFNKVFPK